MPRDDFQKTWGFPSDVLKTIDGAHRYEVTIDARGDVYKSGSPCYMETFSDRSGVEIACRIAMRLTSKAGKEYDVCLRQLN